MRLLLDTHLLIWLAEEDSRLSPKARDLIADPTSDVFFSVASIWELSNKAAVHAASFRVDARLLRATLLTNGFLEIPILSQHAVVAADLPRIHRDPFDRILIAQAQVEDLTLLTVDSKLVRYPGSILRV